MKVLLNFIAGMSGPTFLLFYLGILILCILVYRLSIRFLDKSSAETVPKLDSNLNPYQIAFVRGGEQETLKIVLCALVEKGYLQVNEDNTLLEEKPDHPPLSHLSPLESQIHEWAVHLRLIRLLSKNKNLLAIVRKMAPHFNSVKDKDDLFVNEEVTLKLKSIKWLLLFFFVSIGIFKLVVAISDGRHNVGFLLIMLVIGSITIFAKQIPRLTRKGKKFLENLQNGFSPSITKSSASEENTILLMSIFGFGGFILPQFEFIKTYEKYLQPIHQYSSSYTSGCAGAGSGCSGGSCGGGCGGCGGCGS